MLPSPLAWFRSGVATISLTLPAGRHTRIWDSSSVAAGVYFVRFEAPGFHADRRLVVVR